ncbi:MAG: DUF5666 domain-containing protein [Gammaproteobacteria bacterium]|nr:DUF5666 domain-containing protein [Gammaproteobacteria bacterium]
MVNKNRFLLTAMAAGVIAGLAACGGSNGPSSTGTTSTGPTRVVTGPITAFGSVYVNGEKFETDDAAVYVEDSESNEGELRVGMNVTVKSSSDGTADSIHYDDDAEGEVLSVEVGVDNTGTMNVMGHDVTVDTNTIFESKVPEITQASEITIGNIVEVSGTSSGTGGILATRLEVKALDLDFYIKGDHDSMEVKGNVSGHVVDAGTFMIGNITVSYTDVVVDDSMPAGNWDGLYVEVKTVESIVGNTMVASKVELEDGGSKGEHDDDDELEVKGEISEYVDGTSLTVNGHTFLIDANTTYDEGKSANDLDVGVMVEVEGYTDANGNLVAKEIELEDHDEGMGSDEIEGTVKIVGSVVDNDGTIEVTDKHDMTVTIVVNSNTIMHDDSSAKVTNFNLSMLKDGETVEVHYVTEGDVNTATKLEREDPKEPEMAPAPETKTSK